jgi:HEAT repeat protein
MCLLGASLPVATLHLEAQTPSAISALLKECTDRTNSGDSPAAFNAVLNLAEALGKAPITEIKEALPGIMQAVDDKNPAIRSLALSSLVAIENRSNPDQTLRGDALPLLEPEVPRIAAHLTDEDAYIRGAAATVLGGFGPKAPDSVFAPLVAYLKREDAINSIGSSIVFQLVRLGPQRGLVEEAIITFINRPDQNPECFISSIEAIAHAQTQNEIIDAAIVHHLGSTNSSVRAAVIRALPELVLPADAFPATQTHLRQIAANEQEDPAVRAEANEILPCWNNDRRKPCPTFTLPPPAPGPSETETAEL